MTNSKSRHIISLSKGKRHKTSSIRNQGEIIPKEKCRVHRRKSSALLERKDSQNVTVPRTREKVEKHKGEMEERYN